MASCSDSFPTRPTSNGRLELRHGDRVLMYTDGLTETQNAKGDFLDQEGVRRWLVSARAPTPRTWLTPRSKNCGSGVAADVRR